MKQIKLINATFDETTGISTVVLSTYYGIFTGIAKLHPNDKEYQSHLVGCEYAEIRAKIKYFKAMLSDYKIRYNTLKNLNLDIAEINHNINNYKNKIIQIQNTIQELNNTLIETDKQRNKIHNKLKQWAKLDKSSS